MLIRHAPLTRESEVTAPELYVNRRHFLAWGAAGAAAAALFPKASLALPIGDYAKAAEGTGDDDLTSFKSITTYNNFTEFASDKESPSRLAPSRLKTTPWAVTVEGECMKPGTVSLEDLIKPHQLEERIYRLRCVEAWSMVIPWIGVPLAEVLKRFEPTSKAKFVEFTSLADPKQMPALKTRLLEWPYLEGLRIDEAMHPLAFLVVGLYGKELPAQNGAPLRLALPWKYGFKSAKSIVRIRFVEKQPQTTWMKAGDDEYGFYSNVNPNVDHPRWSQTKERRIGSLFRRPTLMFNGYDDVASLYSGMDLKKDF